MDQKLLRNEVYVVPFKTNTLAYAPLTRHVAIYEGEATLDELDPAWIAEAIDPTNVPAFIEERGFAYDIEKIRLRLNITSRCNLACEYCSVKAVPTGNDMPIETAFKAVREFALHGRRLGSRELEVVFSGGEPSLRLPYIEDVVRFAKESIGTDLKLSPRILTNGFFPGSYVPRIADLFQEVQLSWDGDFRGNPRYGSSDRIPRQVWANLRALLATGVPVSVLTVVSPENFRQLHQIVDELYSAGVRHIFLALEDALGRSAERGGALNFRELSAIYLELWRKYQAMGVEINLTGTDVHSISPFPCSVPIPNYSVAPNGTISACTIAFSDPGGYAAAFQIGALRNGSLNLDQERIRVVRRYSVLNMDGCRGCFAKWHCRGGCPYSKARQWPDPLPDGRCELVRAVVAEKICVLSR